MAVKHKFTSAKSDDSAAAADGQVLPSHWNDDHQLAASSTDNALVRWDGTGGDSIQNSGVIIDDNNNLKLVAYEEKVFAVTDGATVNLDPNNGSIQTWTLGANRTPDQANWAAGQSITLMVDDGSAYTITWTTLAPVWKTGGGSAPKLNTSGFTVIQLWKVAPQFMALAWVMPDVG